MNKILSYILTGCMLATLLLWTGACRPNQPEDDKVPEGMCEVRFRLGGAYADIPALANSKDGKTPKAESTTYRGKEPLPLPEGSTLWLIHETGSVSGNGSYRSPYDTNWTAGTPKSYVVVSSEAGNALYPCQVDGNGNAIPGTIEPSLYLEPALYRFRAVSPARPWDDATNYGYRIDNGDTLLANDSRYTQTLPTVVNLSMSGTGNTGVQMIELNPLAYQTALIQFIICPGDGIHQLGLLPAGIELTGCQDIIPYDNGNYNWSALGNQGKGDTIVAYPGNKRGRTSVHSCTYVQQDSVIENFNFSGERIELPAGSLIANTYILPTDARSNSLIASFNIQMNGIPTYNTLYINRKVFRAGRSYHYIGRVSIEDGVTVFSWQNVQWNTDVEI